MKRFKLTVAYDGTGYCGWQIQPGVPTIEGELNKALSRLTGEKYQVTEPAGRTPGFMPSAMWQFLIPARRYRGINCSLH